MSGLGIPKYILLQYGSHGMSWLLLVMGIMWCSFSWWKLEKNRTALTILISSGITLLGIILLVSSALFMMFSFRSSGPSSASGEMIQGVFIGIIVIIITSWLVCSISFFSLGYCWIKKTYPNTPRPNDHPAGRPS